MSVGPDIGIDPEADRRHHSFAFGNGRNDIQLSLALDIEAADSAPKAKHYLLVALPHSGINYPGSGESGLEGGPDFPSANAVGSQAF